MAYDHLWSIEGNLEIAFGVGRCADSPVHCRNDIYSNKWNVVFIGNLADVNGLGVTEHPRQCNDKDKKYTFHLYYIFGPNMLSNSR